MMSRRTTTSMVYKSRRRAGLPMNRKTSRNSLVNYLQKDGTGFNSRWSAMNANSSSSNRTDRVNAMNLQTSSSMLTEQAKLLGEKVDNESATVTSAAKCVVSQYNETMKNLSKASGALNSYYQQSMREITAANKNALAEIGITVSAGGSLVLDQEKFEAADGEAVKKVLGSEGDFVKRISFVASRISDNASANVESTSNRYNSSGNLTNSYLSKYNYRG